MKIIVLFLLSCTSLFAGDEISISTTTSTNAETGHIITKHYLTRCGVTNLICDTIASSGIKMSQVYRFFHDGKEVADYMYHLEGDRTYFNNWSSYQFRFWSVSNEITEAWITDNGKMVDLFVNTNGVLAPDPTNDWVNRYYMLPDATNTIPKNE